MKLLHRVAFIAVSCFFAITAQAAKPGDIAPDFTVQDSLGKTHKRDEFKGKYVVFEWHNRECPYVKKHYDSGNMQRLQKEWTGKGVIWLTIVSSAPGKAGFADARAANAEMTKAGAMPSAVILDAKGELAKSFGAKTTPHMFVMNPEGRLVYAGAIDDKVGTEIGEVAGAHNYVDQALQESMAKKPVSNPSTNPYGCGVKF